MNQDVIELQERLAFQEDLIERLDQTIASQQKQLDKLALQLVHLNKKIKQLEHHKGIEVDHSPPPHY